ncbi:hypothetical protein ABTE87_21920, partial [Acinetobacter baumannii]
DAPAAAAPARGGRRRGRSGCHRRRWGPSSGGRRLAGWHCALLRHSDETISLIMLTKYQSARHCVAFY